MLLAALIELFILSVVFWWQPIVNSERFNMDAPPADADDDPDSDEDGAHIPSLDDSAHEEMTAQVCGWEPLFKVYVC